jgi:hypothetical protein
MAESGLKLPGNWNLAGSPHDQRPRGREIRGGAITRFLHCWRLKGRNSGANVPVPQQTYLLRLLYLWGLLCATDQNKPRVLGRSVPVSGAYFSSGKSECVP